MAKKAQYAVPAILITTIVLLIIYLVLVNASERAKFLGIEVPNETNVTKSPLGGSTKVIFSSGEVAEIGKSSGESVFEFKMDDVYLSYPAKEKILDSRDIQLRANVISSDSSYFAANNLNLENTKEIILRFNITSVKGSPYLVVYLNNSKILEKAVGVGLLNVRIPISLLKQENPINVELKHKGAFWSSSSIEAKVELVQVFYDPEFTQVNRYVSLGQTNLGGNEVRISFTPTEVVPEGQLIIKINNKTIFKGEVSAWQAFSTSVRFDDSNIHLGENTITFETEKGGVYNLTDVKIEFVAVATPSAKKVYSFDIPKEDLESGKDIILAIRVSKVIKPGYIYAKIGNNGPMYYFNHEDVVSGAWAYVKLDKEYLSEFGNNIILYSPTGRYRLSGFMIILGE